MKLQKIEKRSQKFDESEKKINELSIEMRKTLLKTKRESIDFKTQIQSLEKQLKNKTK